MRKYRAMITRDRGPVEDWGFYDLMVHEGTVMIRTLESTEPGGFDTFLAPGTWRQIEDLEVIEED